MEDFELPSLDSGNGPSSGPEKTPEQSEKQKESSKRAQSQLQKTKKDEQKAKWDNTTLFYILARFIQNPLYDDLIPIVTALLESTYPSRFILCIIALVSPEAAEHLLGATGRGGEREKFLRLHHYSEKTPFHNDAMHPSIRDWVSLWMTSSQEFLTSSEGSVVLQQKLMTLFSGEKRSLAHEALMLFFSFFLDMRNVSIEKGKAETYAEFISSEYEKSVKKSLTTADKELRLEPTIDASSLFGV